MSGMWNSKTNGHSWIITMTTETNGGPGTKSYLTLFVNKSFAFYKTYKLNVCIKVWFSFCLRRTICFFHNRLTFDSIHSIDQPCKCSMTTKYQSYRLQNKISYEWHSMHLWCIHKTAHISSFVSRGSWGLPKESFQYLAKY